MHTPDTPSRDDHVSEPRRDRHQGESSRRFGVSSGSSQRDSGMSNRHRSIGDTRGRHDRRSFGDSSDRGERRFGDRDGRRPSDRGERRFGDRDGRRPSDRGERRFGDRDDRRPSDRGERRFSDRDDRRSGPRSDDRFTRSDRPERGRSDREERPERIIRPGHAARPDEPPVPQDYDESLLPLPVKAELKSLPKELADHVGAHLVAAGELIDEDPQRAYLHAEAARRRAARLPVVREAAAEAAYAAGEFAAALREYRALRRMSGSVEYLPVIADCERAVGRPRAALELIKETDLTALSANQRVELLIVEAGARADLGQRDEAIRLLEDAIKQGRGPLLAQGRLRFAYAEFLIQAGNLTSGKEWLKAVSNFDPDDELGAAERLEELNAEDE